VRPCTIIEKHTTTYVAVTIKHAGSTVKGNLYYWNLDTAPPVTEDFPGTQWINGVDIKAGSRGLPVVQPPATCSNPPLSDPDCVENLLSNALTVAPNATCTLSPGTYCFDGGLDIDGTLDQRTTSGTVTIYVDGPVAVGAGTLDPPAAILPYDPGGGSNPRPKYLQVYSTMDSAGTPPFAFTRDAKVYGVFYHDPTKPGGSRISEGGQFYGTIVDTDGAVVDSDGLHLSEAQAHYDIELGDAATMGGLPGWLTAGSGTGPVSVRDWKIFNP